MSRPGALRRRLELVLAAAATQACCSNPHWWEVFGSIGDEVHPLPKALRAEKAGGGYLSASVCRRHCPSAQGLENCYVAHLQVPGQADDRALVCHYEAAERCWLDDVGRMPSGRGRPRPLAEPTVRAALAEMRRLEAASVGAFHRLADALEALGAPARLVRQARRAAADEVRHARLLEPKRPADTSWAATDEARPPRLPAPQSPDPPRDVQALRLTLALENAVEGCIDETFGALLAWHQATHAEPALRPLFQRIAPDETRHGALSWAIHAWLMAGLEVSGRVRVEAAMQTALSQLAATPPLPADALAALGLPQPSAWRRLAHAFADEVARAA